MTSADGAPVTVTNNQFTMPAQNVTVTASFKEQTVTPGGDNWTTYVMTVDSSNNGKNNVHWTVPNTTLSYGGISWTTTVEGTTSLPAQTTYAQIGKKAEPATKVEIKTSGFAGKTVKSVVVTGYCMSNEGPTVTVIAGATTMLDKKALVKTNSTDYATDSDPVVLGGSDDLTIVYNSSAAAAIVISKIEVVYQ